MFHSMGSRETARGPCARGRERMVELWRTTGRRVFFVSWVGCLVSAACFQWGSAFRAPTTASDSRVDSAPAPSVIPYPKGHWRSLDHATLGHVLIWVSHVLIRHEGSAGRRVSFAPSQWQSLPPAPNRSRTIALALATRVAEEAKGLRNLAPLAQSYSDDEITRETAGSLGGVPALQFITDPEVLDALESLQSGQISRVVETRYGFHVFQRHEPPADILVTGAHIVIGHDDARWLHEFVGRRPIPPRPPNDAQRLAQELFEKLRKDPGLYPSLVAKWSEHRDATWGGDFGSWSTRDVTPFPREIELLSHLEVGQVAPPIDTMFGFELVMRMPNRPREALAMSALKLRFDPRAAHGAPTSRESVRDEALSLVHQLADGKRGIGDVARQHSSFVQVRWQEGRKYGALTHVLSGLPMGGIASVAVEWDDSFFIAQRIDPATLPEERPSLFDFPQTAQ
jgi:hypothetical protein